jgi:hypothetical protein
MNVWWLGLAHHMEMAWIMDKLLDHSRDRNSLGGMSRFRCKEAVSADESHAGIETQCNQDISTF